MGMILVVLLAVLVATRYGAFGDTWRSVIRQGARLGFLVGGAGFALGFFGPLIFAPDANQGPLLGIFITGPLGFLGGLIVGAGREWWRLRTTETR